MSNQSKMSALRKKLQSQIKDGKLKLEFDALREDQIIVRWKNFITQKELILENADVSVEAENLILGGNATLDIQARGLFPLQARNFHLVAASKEESVEESYLTGTMECALVLPEKDVDGGREKETVFTGYFDETGGLTLEKTNSGDFLRLDSLALIEEQKFNGNDGGGDWLEKVLPVLRDLPITNFTAKTGARIQAGQIPSATDIEDEWQIIEWISAEKAGETASADRQTGAAIFPDFKDFISVFGDSRDAEIIQTGLNFLGIEKVEVEAVRLVTDLRRRKLHLVSLASRATFLGARLNLYARVPEIAFGAELGGGEKLRLQKVLEHFFGASDFFTDVYLSSFSLQVNPAQSRFELSMTVGSEDFKLGPFGLENVLFGVSKAGEKLSGFVGAVFSLGKIKFVLEGKIGSERGWQLSGSTLDDDAEITLPKLLEAVSTDELNLTSLPIPHELQTASLKDLSVGIAASNLSLEIAGKAHLAIRLPWNAKEIRFDAEAGFETYQDAADKNKRKFEGFFQGEIAAGNSAVAMRVEVGKSKSFRGFIPAGKEIRLSEILGLFLPEAAELPHNLGDIAFKSLDVQINDDHTGYVRGSVEGFWKFPFGQTDLKIEKADFALEKKASGDVSCSLGVTGQASLTEEIAFKKFAFSFDYDGKQNWKLGGAVNALIFATEFELRAFYAQQDSKKLLNLAYEIPLRDDGKPPQPLVEIENVCSLSIREISLSVAVDAEDADANWDFAARGDFALYYFGSSEKQSFAEIKNGQLRLAVDNEKSSLVFSADDARMHFPLYRYEIVQSGVPVSKNLEIIVGLEHLEIAREKENKWRFEAASLLQFKDVPAPLDKVFADEIKGKLLITDDRASISVSRLAKPLEVVFPPIAAAHGEIDLGTGAADLRDITLSLGKDDLRLSGDLAFGIPSNLNKIFGTDAEGEASLTVFRTYAADGTEKQKADSMLRFGFDFGTKGLSAKLKNSPFEKVKIENNALIIDLTKEKDIGTDRDLGRIEIDLPELKFDLEQGSFSARGGFRIDKKRGLKLPLAPLRELFKAFNAESLADALPYSLPLTEFSLFDPATQSLRVDGLLDLCEKANISVPSDIRNSLREFGKIADRLPNRFKHYLNVSIPDSLDFKLDVTPDGGVRFNVQADEERPLKFLVPGFPTFTGIELRGFSFGEAFGGSLFVVDADFRLDSFDLPTLITCLAIPFDELPDYLPPSTAVHKTLIVEELFMFIIYQTVIPIPVPVFYKELGVSYTDVLGTEWEAHFNFPRPVFNASEAMSLISEFTKFFSHLNDRDDQYLINLERLPKQMNVTYTIGPNYIRLPKFFGKKTEENDKGEKIKVGQIIGFKDGLGSFDSLRVLAVLLNTLKKGSINYLIKQTDLNKRLGHQSLELFDVFNIDVAWALTTPQEFVESGHRMLTDKVTEAFRQKYPGKNLPPPQGTGELLAMLPVPAENAGARIARIDENQEGAIVFLRGIMLVGDAVTFDTAFGFLAIDERGFGCGMSFRGDVAGILESKLYGLIKIDRSDPDEHFKLAGHASFKMFGREILLGEFSVSDNEFRIRGKVDLFPAELLPDFPLRIYSGKPRREVQKPEDTYINGFINRERFLFDGGMNFEFGAIRLGSHLSVRAGKFTDKAGVSRELSQVVLKVYLFDATITFVFLQTGKRLQLAGECTPVNYLNGLLRITGENAHSGAMAYLELDDDKFKEFYLAGNLQLLGIASFKLKITANPREFTFKLRHTFQLSGLSSGLEVNCLLVPGDRFQAGAQFVLNLDLGQILRDLIYSITKLWIDFPSLKVGCQLNLDIVAEESVAYTPGQIEASREKQDDWFEKRRRLAEQSRLFTEKVADLRDDTRKRRLAAERKVADARRQIEEKKARIQELQAEVAGLEKQLVEASDETTREEYREKLLQWKTKIERIGGSVEEVTGILSKQKRALQNAFNDICDRLESIENAAFELEDRGQYKELKQLNKQIALLREERERQEARLAELEDIQIAPHQDSLSEELEKQQASAEKIISEADRQAYANAEASIDSLEGNFKTLLSIFEHETSVTRELTPANAQASASAFIPPSPRNSRLAFGFDMKFRFLGLELELFGINFELHGLDRVNMNDYSVLSDLPAIILKEISRNIGAMVGRVLNNFDKVFWHLVRFVFDENFRNWCLSDTASYALPPDAATDSDLKHSDEIKAKLVEAAWTPEEVEILQNR